MITGEDEDSAFVAVGAAAGFDKGDLRTAETLATFGFGMWSWHRAVGAPLTVNFDDIFAQANAIPDAELAAGSRSGTAAQLRSAGAKDAHHIIQDAAVRDLPGYSNSAAPAVQLPGPATRVGTPHYAATQVQRQAGGGTYAAERFIGYKAMRLAGIPAAEARRLIQMADDYFRSLGVGPTTRTRIPGNR